MSAMYKPSSGSSLLAGASLLQALACCFASLAGHDIVLETNQVCLLQALSFFCFLPEGIHDLIPGSRFAHFNIHQAQGFLAFFRLVLNVGLFVGPGLLDQSKAGRWLPSTLVACLAAFCRLCPGSLALLCRLFLACRLPHGWLLVEPSAGFCKLFWCHQ